MNENVRIISLEDLNRLLDQAYPGQKVVVSLIEAKDRSGNVIDHWVFDSMAQMEPQLPGVRDFDRFLSGRMDGSFFQYGQRDPSKASWGQPELREEPRVLQEVEQRRLVGYVRVEQCGPTGRVRVKQSSLSNGQVIRQDGDQSIGFFRTNAARIDGDVEVLRQDTDTEAGEGWKTPLEIYTGGDQRLMTPLALAGIFPVQKH